MNNGDGGATNGRRWPLAGDWRKFQTNSVIEGEDLVPVDGPDGLVSPGVLGEHGRWGRRRPGKTWLIIWLPQKPCCNQKVAIDSSFHCTNLIFNTKLEKQNGDEKDIQLYILVVDFELPLLSEYFSHKQIQQKTCFT